MKPTKTDFEQFLLFSQNIPDKNINPRIEEGYKFTIRPRLDVLAVDIYALDAVGYNSLTYVAADYTGPRPELVDFYHNFVLHWWILLSMKRFLQSHGFNLTQFGMTKTNDPQGTYVQMSPAERVIQGKQFDSDADVLYTLLITAGKDADWTFDEVVYRAPGSDSCRRGGRNEFGISAIG